MMDPISKFVVDNLIDVTAQLLMPVMVLGFFGGILVRLLVYYVANSENHFAKEFQKRVVNHYANPENVRVESFSRIVRIMLDKTYNECFEIKNKYKRRNLDYITGLADRLFLIEEGVKRGVQDTLKSIRYLKKTGPDPKMIEISKTVFENNPYFERLVGVFPVGKVNDILNILPGLFIIGGIFGTFLGISKGLPDLGQMDLGNMEETKRVMDLFLMKISQAMVKSIIGIAFSVLMSIINTFFSPESLYYNLINRYASALDQMWHETSTNELDKSDASSTPPPLAKDDRRTVAA